MKDGVYLFGGWSEPLTSDFLPNGSNNWIRGPEIPSDLEYNCKSNNEFCMIAGTKISNEEFVLVGLGELHRILAKYNINTKTWERKPLKIPRHGHSCSFLNGEIIISGGSAWRSLDNKCNLNFDVWTEVINTTTWKSRVAINGAFNEDFHYGGTPIISTWTRAAHGTVLMTIENNIRLVAFGGSLINTDFRPDVCLHRGKLFFDVCKMWDEQTEKWVEIDLKLSQGRKEIRYLSIPYLERNNY